MRWKHSARRAYKWYTRSVAVKATSIATLSSPAIEAAFASPVKEEIARWTRHLRAENKSPKTITTYREAVEQLFAFLAPVIIGGRHAPTSVAGTGFAELSKALRLRDVEVERVGDDLLVSGYLRQ